MQHLQWFPGHMTAAMRMMEENLKAVDGVMIVLDARAPRASLNRKLDKLFVNKKVLYVINKCDLVDVKDVKRTVTEFAEEGKEAVDRYIDKFLSGGGSKDPIDLLKDAGVDMSTPEPVENALKVFEEYLSLFEQMV